MTELHEVTERVSVPRNTGVPGFLRTLEAILKLNRVQHISIRVDGTVEYSRYAADGDTATAEVNFEGLSLRELVVGGQVFEVPSGVAPHQSVVNAFMAVQLSAMVPVAWVAGEAAVLREWFELSGVQLVDVETFMGLPVHFDTDIEASALILCAAHSRQGSVYDCTKFYKVTMAVSAPRQLDGPTTEVEVL